MGRVNKFLQVLRTLLGFLRLSVIWWRIAQILETKRKILSGVGYGNSKGTTRMVEVDWLSLSSNTERQQKCTVSPKATSMSNASGDLCQKLSGNGPAWS